MVLDTTLALGDLFALSTNSAVLISTCTSELLLLTSVDVIHALALPNLSLKLDAIPGRISATKLSSSIFGSFSGQCSELCGAMHSFMPLSVVFQ